MSTRTDRTRVAIVGAGPAGLLLSHLLAGDGIDSVVLDSRTREEIETTIRAGIVEHPTVDLLAEQGLADRLLAEGERHDGIELAWDGGSHRIDFADLVGRAVWLYPQHEVLTDLIAARLAAGGDVRFGVRDVALHDVDGDAPSLTFTEADGTDVTLRCESVAGCDGSAGVTRASIPREQRADLFRAYPFGWFGILTQAPKSAPELIYAQSPAGFALISTRTHDVQRMYFQCDPATDPDSYTDEQIWHELQSRVSGTTLVQGPIFSRTVVAFRSFVCEPMHHGRLFLAGDAAHTVPPTGAKGMNLAIADVAVLHRALVALLRKDDEAPARAYTATATKRVWRAEHFSWWFTSLLHTAPDASPFDVKRAQGELEMLTSSRAGQTLIAESYTGWPHQL